MWEMAANVFKWVCRMTGITRLKQPAIIGAAYYDGPEVALDEIEAHLLKFSGGSIDLEIHDDGIATLCISNYEKRNAISGKMMVDLRRAVSRLEAWAAEDAGARGLLLRGVGGTFCSGGDLQMAQRAVGPHGAAYGFQMATYMHHTLARLARLPLLSAVLIEGSGALGGGAELALACDWRLATHDAKGIGLVHGRLGVVPAWGGGQRLVQLLGRTKALEVLATARVFPPNEALALSLIDHIIPAAQDDPRQKASSKQPLNGIVNSRENSSSAEKVSDAVGDLVQTAGATGVSPPYGGGVQRGEETVAVRAAREWLRQRTRHPTEVLRAIKVMCAAPLGEGAGEVVDERRVFAPLWGGRAQERAIESRIRHP